MKRFFAAALLPATLLLAGCHDPNSGPSNAGGQTGPPPAQTGPGPSAGPLQAPAATPGKVVVYVLNPKATSEEALLMPREVPVTHPEEPAKDAVNALLEASRSPLAPGVFLRGVSVDNGVATLDFSQSPIKAGGEGAESAGLNALAMTLGQFTAISSYQIKVQGTDVKAFGEFTTDGPMDVIRPGAPPPAGGGQ